MILVWLSDYLWGIETLLLGNLIPEVSCRFQTTYEELKHESTAKFFRVSNCFQTTYEELKLKLFLVFVDHPLRFQTTYEELKQSMEV